MEINKDITLSSYDNQLDLSVHIEGCENPKAIIQFSHGMAEHKERYYDFIRFLNENGYLCVINDHRGHGESVKHKDDYGYFYDDKGYLIIEDLHLITQYMKTNYPDLPIYMFSHSMGTLVARNYIQKYDDEISKLVLCGPPYDNKASSFGYLIAKLIAKTHGDKHRSKLIQKMTFGAFDKKFGGLLANEWICSDSQQVSLYNKDAKCGFIFTTNGFKCLFYLMKSCYQKVNYHVKNKKLPMLFIAGEDDPVIGNQKKFLEEIQFMHDLGYKNTRYILYSGMRHEILNERKKEQVYQDVLDFFD